MELNQVLLSTLGRQNLNKMAFLMVAKCGLFSIFAMPVEFTGKYLQIPEDTGKYDLQPWNFYTQH